MHGLWHVGEASFGDEIVDEIGLRLDCADVAESRVHGGGVEPRIPQVRMPHVVQVKVGIDEGDLGHWVRLS